MIFILKKKEFANLFIYRNAYTLNKTKQKKNKNKKIYVKILDKKKNIIIISLREKCGLHTPIFLRFARQSLTHLHAFFDGVHTSMLALLRHPKWTFFSVLSNQWKWNRTTTTTTKCRRIE